MDDLRKQDAGKSGGETSRENFNADEIAEQSAYTDSTEVAQQMRRGGEENKDRADDRDAAGKADIAEWDQRQVQEEVKEQ
jgi:general stress protein YciG